LNSRGPNNFPTVNQEKKEMLYVVFLCDSLLCKSDAFLTLVFQPIRKLAVHDVVNIALTQVFIFVVLTAHGS